MQQSWYEMGDIRRKKLKNSVWIPLRSMYALVREGKYGHLGYKEDFFGLGSIAVPIEHKKDALELGWSDVGIGRTHTGYFEDGEYTPAEIYKSYPKDFSAVHLVLDQRVNSNEKRLWHLNQDFVVTLRLIREEDVWVSPDEGYIEVARLKRNTDGEPVLLEVRAEHLKDYLSARNMGLYTTSYYDRNDIVEDVSFLTWEESSVHESSDGQEWEGRIMAIHEGGGEPYGEKWSMIRVARTDIDDNEDIPNISNMPTDENTTSSSWEKGFEGRKLFRVMGEFWRNQWIDPAGISPRVKEDEPPATVFFIVDEEGKKESKETLKAGGRWLWFKPDVMMALVHRRGGSLEWYSKDTGEVRCSPDYNIHFGVNELGLVNAYAKDISLLPEWQQQIWSGYNVAPEGGVSKELLASHIHATPANTQAPEAHLYDGIKLVNKIAQDKLGITVFGEHDFIPELMTKIHRFRAIDTAGLYALAKDLARVTADSINGSELQTIVAPPKGVKWGTIKSLENLIAQKIELKDARKITAPLVGIYELRLADAHLPSSKVNDSYKLIGMDENLPTIHQAHQMIHQCVTSIFTFAEIIKEWENL